MSEVGTFLAALRTAESGTSKGNYSQIKGRVRSTRLVGAYGIPGDEWKQMAADAGLAGARWSDPRAQDLVVRRITDMLYQKYGDWRLVAAAWKGGEQLADMIAENPELLAENTLSPVKDYISQVMRHASEDIETNKPSMPDGTPVDSARFQSSVEGLPTVQGTRRKSADDALRGILKGMRSRQLTQHPVVEDEGPGPVEITPAASTGVDTQLSTNQVPAPTVMDRVKGVFGVKGEVGA